MSSDNAIVPLIIVIAVALVWMWISFDLKRKLADKTKTISEMYSDLIAETAKVNQLRDELIEAHVQIERQRIEIKGPDPYATWAEAAIAERVLRVNLEHKLKQYENPSDEAKSDPL